jgi:hypothetical protein
MKTSKSFVPLGVIEMELVVAETTRTGVAV